MEETLIKMAQQAGGDSALLASLIRRYGEKEGLDWEQVAGRLRVDSLQLAKLALCRRPRQSQMTADITRIAGYVGMNQAVLSQFLGAAEPVKESFDLAGIWGQFQNGFDALFKRRVWALSFAALILVIMGAVAFAQPRFADATLVVSQGEAVVQNQAILAASNQSPQVVMAGNVMTVRAGDEIRLGAGAKAQLRLYDGSTVDIFENSSVEVSELTTSEGTYRVGLNMLAGKTVSRVVRLLGAGDAFKVSTPSSTASVRGTIFTVEVISPESTHVVCDEGVVVIEMVDGQQAEVPAGYEVMAVVGQPLDVTLQGAEPVTVIAAATEEEVEAFPPGPPAAVPGDTPEKSSASDNDTPPADEGLPPGQILANGDFPPGEVPGKTPSDVPGKPPTSVEEPPGRVKTRDKPPDDTILTSGEEDDDEETVTEVLDDEGGSLTDSSEGDEDKEKTGGPPDQVPGNTPNPDDKTGEGTPPTGGGDPPGQQDKEPKDNPSSSNQGGGKKKDG